MDKETAIKVQNVSKVFKIPHEKVSSLRGAFANALTRSGKSEEFKALDDVSFEVKKGEFFGIIGRNGSGKSTLLKILAGIYQPNTGKVHIDGMVAPFLELGIGFNPELSGRDNVYLNATVLGMTQKQIDKKFDDIVKFSELERFIDQKLKNYSSGMQVRLAFSVSIHANRDILLMDEVLAVGDSNFQSKCLTEFAKYRDMGRTVVIVTHDIAVVQRYCDRAMLLRSGKIMKIGNAEEVGNEYVYENMSDEEKRIRKEQEQEGIRAEKERLKAEKEAEKLKGKEREEEEKRLDNEKRRLEEEKQKQEEERKNKVAEIIKVEFLDKNGNVKNVFGAGDDIFIRVYFKLHKTTKELNFGISLFTQENDYIFGGNTILDKIDGARYREKGYFEVAYNNVPLHSSTYYIKAGIFGNDDSVRYDFLEKSKEFKIYSKSKNPGLVEFNYSWK